MAVLMNPDGSPISLFFQQIWCEIDLISGDYLNAELSQGILTVKEDEQLVGRLVVQLFSCVRIDMAHHQINVFLFLSGQNVVDHSRILWFCVHHYH